MKKISFVLFLIFGTSTLYGQDRPLTVGQKVNDFEYLYQTLKDNYPYFGVGLRQTGIDWLSKKEEYLSKIRETPDDSAYIFALKSILGELGNGHADMSCVLYWEGYTYTYKKMLPGSPRYEKWIEVLESQQARPLYWKNILESEQRQAVSGQQNAHRMAPVYRDSIIAKDRIGIMRIPTFSFNYIEKDSAAIALFLDQVRDLDYLIIDIQNNGGGTPEYWSTLIVQRLIRDTIFHPRYFLIKDGAVNRHFYPDYFDNSTIVKKEGNLQNIPPELLDGTYRLKIETDTIPPNNPVPFGGKIYLLVDQVVFSASENFANFCKSNGWATIAGTRTGGDGIGSDPALIIAPGSGIIIRYTALSGFNHEGSLNFEERTVPDIPVEGKNSDERLQNLIDLIKSNR